MNNRLEQIKEAQRLKDTGQIDRAEAICQEVLRSDPHNASALHLLGAIMHLRGRQQDAISYLRQAVQVEPENASFWVTLGGNLAIAGKMEDATACFKKAVEANPQAIDAQYNLGLANKHLKEFAAAEECFTKTLELAPNHIDAMANLGFVLQKQGRKLEAKACFSAALQTAPTQPLAITSLASMLAEEGNPAEAQSLLRALDSNASEATLFQLATTYDLMSENALAIGALRHLVAKYGNSAEAHAALATALIGDFQIAEGIEYANSAIKLDPKCASAWCALGIGRANTGELDLAEEALSKTTELVPSIGPKFLKDLMLPCIMGTTAEVAASRRKFEANLDRLLLEDHVSHNPFAEIGFTYFYLAYHGENDVHLQRKIAALYRKVAPSLSFTAPHCIQQTHSAGPLSGRKIRLGFYSRYIATHSVAYSFASIVDALNASGIFDLHLITQSNIDTDEVRATYPSLGNNGHRIPRDLDAARSAIAKLELDILVYLDIGMDPLSFLLAFARLAPVQCVMGGHPVTTGISTIDYFFSAEAIEIPNAQDHYSEKLVLLKHGGFKFMGMEMATHLKSRAELGMPTTHRLYLCPMTLQKIHPDFDVAVEKILTKDPDGSVVFFESMQSPEWARLLKARFDRTLSPAVRKRVVFMPWIIDQQELISIIAQSDVVLDPFHFGIGTTGIHVFTAGTPFVTRPSQYLRGRVGYLFCNLLEIHECITHGLEEYVNAAIQIASNTSLRDELKARIHRNSHRIFDNVDAAPEFIDVLKQLVLTHQRPIKL
jgi:predicted O-linked N-acetylglucosamine transferase (SPINDLY family)